MSRYDASRVIEQLLRQHEAGLRMYIVCRLGDAHRLPETYAAFKDALLRGSGEDLQTAPSLAAYAYAAARRSAGDCASAQATGLEHVAWLPPREDASSDYSALLDRIRTELDRDTLEILELGHARGLSLDDITYVTGLEASATSAVLAQATETIRRWANGLERPAKAERLIRDTFCADTRGGRTTATQTPLRASRLAEGSMVGGRFEVCAGVQVGALESVYAVADTSVPGQRVALHLLHRPATTTSARTGLLRKLRLLGSVIHPSIERILDYGWHGSQLWYATPLYEGHSLEQLAEARALSQHEAIDIFAPLARGIAALHENGVVLREISPAGIVISRIGGEGSEQTLVVLQQFASWLSGELALDDSSRFVAPEVASRLRAGQGPGAAGEAEDVFALGLALFDSLEGGARNRAREPWPDFLATRAEHPLKVPGNGRFAPFAALLRRMLELIPEARPPATEVASELERLEPAVAARRRRAKVWVPLSFAAVVLVLVLVAAFVRDSRLELIRELRDIADAQTLQEALEAERERSKRLEAELDSRDD